MEPRFIEIKTEDGLNLPGLLYHSKNSKKVVDILKECQPDFDYQVIKNADHSFSKPEHLEEVFIKIAEWLM